MSTAGGSADVWLAEDVSTEDIKLSEDDDTLVQIEGSAVRVAIKIYRPKNALDDGSEFFKKEFKTVFNCHHANLLKPTAYSINGDIPYLVMPFCEKGSVESMVGKVEDENIIWKFICDVASGLEYLHSYSPPIIHQDIKPANILIDDKDNFCITDFGISVRNLEDDEEARSSGTKLYMPPERFGKEYMPLPESDIWALGITIFELIMGYLPFKNGGKGLYGKENMPLMPDKVPRKIKKIILQCLNPDPSKRPTAHEVAEMARSRGKISKSRLGVGLGIVLMAMVASVVGWVLMKPYNQVEEKEIKIDKFTLWCNKGDSVLKIEMKDAENMVWVDAHVISQRWEEAIGYYSNALREHTDSFLCRQDVEKRMENMAEMITYLTAYKGVCDSVNLCEKYDMPEQYKVYVKKRERMSDKIKEKIREL